MTYRYRLPGRERAPLYLLPAVPAQEPESPDTFWTLSVVAVAIALPVVVLVLLHLRGVI